MFVRQTGTGRIRKPIIDGRVTSIGARHKPDERLGPAGIVFSVVNQDGTSFSVTLTLEEFDAMTLARKDWFE